MVNSNLLQNHHLNTQNLFIPQARNSLNLLFNFHCEYIFKLLKLPGPVAQLVASPIADPGVMGLILARSHIFVEIDREIFSTVR